jgi:hypothetical protein
MDAVRATSMNVRFGKSFSSRYFLSPDLHLTSLPNLLSLTIKEYRFPSLLMYAMR